VLGDEEYGLMITTREYYNQIRKMKADKDKPKTVEGILVALHEAGFIFRTRQNIEEDGTGKVINRKLIQIFFAHRKQLDAAKRFVSGWLLVIDSTFNANKLRLPLLVIVGVLNTGNIFPEAFSFCPSESRETFDFIWESLKEECFTPNIPPPRVVLGDWAQGLVASVPDAFPNAFLQGCDWHAVQAMVRWFCSKGYSTNEIDGYITEDKIKIEGLEGMAWGYVKSMSLKDLESNRAYLVENLKPEDKQYILKNWQEREPRFIWYYTKSYPNLGSTSSQRGESYHDIVRELTNGQLCLEDATKHLISKVLSILKDIETSEGISTRLYPRLLQSDPQAFRNLRCTITIYAAQKIEVEWKAVRDALITNEDMGPSSCQFELLLRYGLPCKHVLQLAFESGDPILRSLIHPQYWLNGPIVHMKDWQPRYPKQAPMDYMNNDILQISDSGQQLTKLRDTLNVEERSRFDAQIERSQLHLISIGERHRIMQDLPIGNPDPIPRCGNRKKKIHGANSRLETGPETAKRLQLAQEKAQRQATKECAKAAKLTEIQIVKWRQAFGQIDEQTVEEEIKANKFEIVPDSLECPSTPLQQKQTHNLVSRTLIKSATPAEPPLVEASKENLYELPASTVPAESRSSNRPRRERVQTE
jgi:hypothetical protein